MKMEQLTTVQYSTVQYSLSAVINRQFQTFAISCSLVMKTTFEGLKWIEITTSILLMLWRLVVSQLRYKYLLRHSLFNGSCDAVIVDIGLSSSRRVDSIAFSARFSKRSSIEHIPGLDFRGKSSKCVLCLIPNSG